jgi:hypothetical protein
MDDQRDYAEEAAVRRDLEREGDQEMADERDEPLLVAIRTIITVGRDRGDASSAILGQVESLLAGVETFLAGAPVVGLVDNVRRETEDGNGESKPTHVEGHAHERGKPDWATQPSGEHKVIEQRKAGA